MSARHWEQNKEATIYVGNLDERFGEPLMWELMTQMGPVVNVHMPMDRVSRLHQGFGFVEYDTPESAEYASRCLNGIRLFGKPIRVNKASADRQRATDIGAELFVNNLDAQVDEKVLYDTFAQFGRLVAPPNVVRDQNNVSKGYGFVNFDSFEASDAAVEAMHGQYLLSKQIAVEYAYKKDGKGERHGDDAERKLAAEGKKHNVVPEIQPLPPAFLMSRPSPAPPTGPAAVGLAPGMAGGMPNGFATGANGIAMASPAPGAYPPSRGPVPTMVAPGAPGGFPPRALPYGSAPVASAQSLPAGFGAPAGGSGRGGGGGVIPPPSYAGPPGASRGGGGGGGGMGSAAGLPMAPTGLPARPGGGAMPPGFGRGGAPPAGFGVGSGAPPMPPGFATGPNSLSMPPPGAPGAGYNGMPPPPPPGFGRR